MRIIAVALALVFPIPALAGYVIHPQSGDPSPPAIVAQFTDRFLDRFNQVWKWDGSAGWLREAVVDPAVPVSELMFWEYTRYVTTSGELYQFSDGAWVSRGFPPSVAGVQEAGGSLHATSIPNPTSAATRIGFSLPSQGFVSARLFDASGRLVRTLLEGDLPAGDVSLTWDGLDDRGEPVPAGVYFSRVDCMSGSIAGKLVSQ